VFHTDADRLQFLLETDAELHAFLSDEDLTAEAGDERPKYITNYIGSKQKLTDWIWKATPDDAASAVDAFSGSAVVAYMYKSKGLGVHAVDRLAYCHHIARAIVENDSATLPDETIDALLADNPKSKDFVRKHFGGIYFEPGVHAVIDMIRSTIDSTGLSGFKKDIALFALGKACITGKGGFGHFGTTQKQEGRADSPKEFKERFASNCRRINALVFKGERPCKALHGDTRKVLPDIKADVAYFDPPYATEFSQTNYERAYHFVEESDTTKALYVEFTIDEESEEHWLSHIIGLVQDPLKMYYRFGGLQKLVKDDKEATGRIVKSVGIGLENDGFQLIKKKKTDYYYWAPTALDQQELAKGLHPETHDPDLAFQRIAMRLDEFRRRISTLDKCLAKAIKANTPRQ